MITSYIHTSSIGGRDTHIKTHEYMLIYMNTNENKMNMRINP